MPTTWLLQKVLKEESSFEEAIARIRNTRTGGPSYFILAGLKDNEGIVIEKAAYFVRNEVRLSD